MKLKKILTIFMFITFFLILNMHARTNISHTSVESARPSIAINSDGVIMVVWCETNRRDGESGTIYYNVYKKTNGTGEWQGTKNAQLSIYPSWTPLLDIDQNGNFHIAYADGGASANREIYHAVYNPNASSPKWGSKKMIYDSPRNSAWQKIDVYKDRIYIVWFHQHYESFGGSDIVMQSKKVGADEWPEAYERISWSASETSIHPAFKVLDDQIHACWMQGTDTHAPWRLFYKEGVRGDDWKNIPSTNAYHMAYYPEMAITDDGDVNIIFSNRTGHVFHSYYDNGEWKTQIISTTHCGLQMADIEFRNSILVASWSQRHDDYDVIVYSKKILDKDWSKPEKVAEGKRAGYQRVWIDDDAKAHFVWEDRISNTREIFYEKLEVSPSDPFLQVSPDYVSYKVEGEIPEDKTIVVKNVGNKSLDYQVTVNKDWIEVSPASGSLNAGEQENLTLNIDATALDIGNYSGEIEISSNEAINSPQIVNIDVEVIIPPLFAPLNFTGEKQENNSLFYHETLHHFTWEANPENVDIKYYRLYEVNENGKTLVKQMNSDTFEYDRREMDPDKTYTYELVAVNKNDLVGHPATVTIK
ncbi:MAG: BACON domain-containing protein [Candidatus Aminicenantaceae bacterium]